MILQNLTNFVLKIIHFYIRGGKVVTDVKLKYNYEEQNTDDIIFDIHFNFFKY